MHLTDGKIDLTRNHEALRVFHDLKPDIRAAIMDQTSNTQAQVSLTERNAAKQPLGRQKKWPYHFSENINIFFPRPTPKTHRGNGPNRQALPVHWTCMAHENAGFLTHKWTVPPWMVASHSDSVLCAPVIPVCDPELPKTSFKIGDAGLNLIGRRGFEGGPYITFVDLVYESLKYNRDITCSETKAGTRTGPETKNPGPECVGTKFWDQNRSRTKILDQNRSRDQKLIRDQSRSRTKILDQNRSRTKIRDQNR